MAAQSTTNRMAWNTTEFWLAIALVIYLLVIGIGAAAVVIVNFPTDSGGAITFAQDSEKNIRFLPLGTIRSSDQGLALIALLAGIAGSFLHAAQSLSSYIGNKTFKASWTTWYFLRPWIGGILGITFYFAIRAGVIAGASTMSPYSVVAFGLLGGWFSKTATDKLQEVFETLFKTDQDKQRYDKLSMPKQPSVEEIRPSPVPANKDEITVLGRNFMEGATVQINDDELQADFVSETELRVPLGNLQHRPTNTEASIRVKNPEGPDALSEASKVKFE